MRWVLIYGGCGLVGGLFGETLGLSFLGGLVVSMGIAVCIDIASTPAKQVSAEEADKRNRNAIRDTLDSFEPPLSDQERRDGWRRLRRAFKEDRKAVRIKQAGNWVRIKINHV